MSPSGNLAGIARRMSRNGIAARLRERRGAVLILVAVSTAALMGVLALAVDVGSMGWQRRIAQTAADAGAIAGASEIIRGRADLVISSAQAETARNGFTHGANGVTVTVSHAPVSGYYVADTRFVEVVVSRTVPTFIAGVLGTNTVRIKARAVAGAGAQSSTCVYSLEDDAEKAVNVSGSTSRLDVGCGLIVNSTNTKAVLIESGGTLDAEMLAVTGGIDGSGGNVTVSGSMQSAVPPSLNPLAYLQVPAFDPNACTFTNTKVDTYGVTTTLTPGIYCGGIEITSNGSASLSPGLYILRGGGLKMGGGSITGTGVTLLNTNARTVDGGADKFGKFEMGSASTANLSAMTSGSLAGILFFQDPAAGKPGVLYENVIGSGSNAVFTGTFYFPTQPIELGASGSTTTINGGVVATTIKVTSGSTVDFSGTYGASNPLKRLSLVE